MVSEYIHAVAHEEQEDAFVRQLATRTWNSLKRSAKAGPRRTVRGRRTAGGSRRKEHRNGGLAGREGACTM